MSIDSEVPYMTPRSSERERKRDKIIKAIIQENCSEWKDMKEFERTY